MKNKAQEIFMEKTKFNVDDIKSIINLRGGSSSNSNFLFELKDGNKYQLKIPDARMVKHKSNYAYTKYDVDLIKYIDQEGLLIKEWIEGVKPDFTNHLDVIKVLQEIKKFHKIELPKDSQESFGLYQYKETTKLSKDLIEEFDELSKILKGYEQGFIHGDINPGNILVDDKRAYLIDLEWAMKGWLILDYAYLIAFSNINPKEVADFSGYEISELKKMVRLVLIHTMMWCENEKTEKALTLFKEIRKKLG